MKNIKLTIEYDGKDFGGWQKQPNKLNIQGNIERAIYEITGEEVELIGSGRTDAGVHSLGQVANFKTSTKIPVSKLAVAINSRLKKSIVIKKAEEVEEKFHSRYHCKRKTYRYIINNSKEGSAIYRYLEYHVPYKLNIEMMQKAAKFFEGEHDFTGFKASGTSSKSSIRTIYQAEVKQKGERIYIELTGNGFLYNMVRIIAGTLVEVGLEKIKPEEIPDIIKSKNRQKAGKTLPAHGLYLVCVDYEEE
ncbi:MAG TPA: tRNA pseudouridine(38-40) synthase TruA [Candidatus Merdicola faecigallinarum]|uniref:tRNA pseudouridine synthase A n=1 Tax=Candidatus Merdicola faecigallinarum TaxID=2840862 RepID=A0A9D1S8L6_9FIRM|nr:tRNA pseudouridine(38-40) synthase TruA [Candidatus Merdicola faecigallinarum]